MNFEARNVTTPEWGNNSDARTVILRVANDEPLLPKQESELAYHFQRWREGLRNGLVGFATKTGRLADGSPWRFVSNSGLHSVMVWPVGGSKRTQLADLFFSVPISPGFASPYEPKPSTLWKYRGKTQPPQTLRAARVIADAVDLQQHPGNITWFNPNIIAKGKPVTVSWYGRGTRYGLFDYYGRHIQGGVGFTYSTLYSPTSAYAHTWFNAFKPAVWLNGVKRAVKLEADDSDVRVISAALRRIDDVLYLYVISKDTSLAVYRGVVGDPFKPKAISVSKLFDIDYTVVVPATGQKHWEALMQLPYFNESGTQIAGLVSVRLASPTNASAAAAVTAAGVPGSAALYFVVLMTVDVDAQSTAFTMEHASATDDTLQDDHTGVMTTAEARTVRVKYNRITYSAVDWSADQMVLAMADVEYTRRIVETGSWTATAHSKLGEHYIASSYRIYRENDDFILAAGTWAELHTDTFYAEAAGGAGTPTPTTASGYREQTFSGEMLRAATVEGGDLRHGLVVAGEILEVGNTAFYETLDESGDGGWHPGKRNGSVSGSFGSMARTPVTSNFQRQDVLRFSVWKDGTLIDTTDYDLSTQVNRCALGWVRDPLDAPPEGSFTNGMEWFDWNQLYGVVGSPVNRINELFLADFKVRGLTFPAVPFGTPHYSCGTPYMNVSAVSNDGQTMFYQVMGGWTGSGSIDNSYAAAFVFGDTVEEIDTDTYFPAAFKPLLASPVFVDNVPLPES